MSQMGSVETTPDNRHVGGDDAANKSHKTKKHKRKREKQDVGSIRSSGTLPSSTKTKKNKKSKADAGMQSHSLPARPPLPITPTRSISKHADGADMPASSNLAVPSPGITQKLSFSEETTSPNSLAGSQRSTPLKTDINSPNSSPDDDLDSERPSSDVEFISERRIRNIQETLDHARQMNKKIRDLHEELRRTKLKLSTAKDDARQEVQKIRKEWEQEKRTSTARINRLEAKTNSYCKDNDRLVLENTNLKHLKQANVDLKQVNDSVRLKAVEQDGQLRNQASDIHRLQNHIEELSKQTTEQSANMEKLASANLSLSGQTTTTIAQLRTQNANLMLDNHNASAKLTILRGDLTAAKSGMQASDEQNQNLTVEIERFMSSETLLIAGNTTLKSTNDKLKSEISTCQSSLEELQATNLKLQVALDEKEASSQKQTAKVANQQQRISELEQAGDVSRSRAEAKITEMRTALDQRTTDLDLKSEQLDACQGENKQLQKDIAALKGNLAAAKNDNSRVRQECETAMKAVDQKTAEFKSLQEQIAGLHSRAVPNTQVALDMSVAQSKAEHKTPAGRVDLHSEELSSEQLHIIYKSYERFDNRYQVQHKGMIVPRPTNRKAWIGSVHAENMLGILSKEDHDAFLSPYREISDLKLEILVDGRILPRGFADLPASREERHALEEAGVSIAESDEGASAFGNAIKSGTRHGELSKRDLALREKMKADREANEQDPRLRCLPAPVAVMVAPEEQADGSVNVKEPPPPKPHDEPVKKPLSRKPGPDVAVQQLPGRLETGSTTEIDSVQTPALTHDEGMSPKETGPITPRSPRPLQSQAAPGALKRKAPVELFDAPKGPVRQPESSVDLLDTRSRWLDSGGEAYNKHVRLASQQDALDRAPRGPRGFRESREGVYDSRREEDPYWSRRNDGEGSNYDRSRAREAYYNQVPRQPAFERRDSRRRSSEYYSDYRVDDRQERWYDRSG